MDRDAKSTFAILSHILPPSPSGQATVLYRLLKNINSDEFCLVSCRDYNQSSLENDATRKLNAAYYFLKPVFQLPKLKRFRLKRLSLFVNTYLTIYLRAMQIRRVIKDVMCNTLIACTGDICDLPAAYLASKWSGIPFVTYMFDDYAFQWTGAYRQISKRLEPNILKKASAVIVPNEYMQKEYSKRYGVESTVIRNPCVIPDLKKLNSSDSPFDPSKTNIVYAGAIYHAHYDAFRNLIAAIGMMKHDTVKLHLYTAQDKLKFRKNGISGDMVVFHPHVNEATVMTVMRQADLLFLPLAFNSPITEVIKTSAPGKIGDYLSVGRPVLVHAPQDSFVSWFFRQKECGAVVDKNNPADLSREITKLIADSHMCLGLGDRARKVAENEFSDDKIATSFYRLINNIMRKQF